MIITAVSQDHVNFAVNVHPLPANVANQLRYIRSNLAATLDQNADFVRAEPPNQNHAGLIAAINARIADPRPIPDELVIRA